MKNFYIKSLFFINARIDIPWLSYLTRLMFTLYVMGQTQIQQAPSKKTKKKQVFFFSRHLPILNSLAIHISISLIVMLYIYVK